MEQRTLASWMGLGYSSREGDDLPGPLPSLEWIAVSVGGCSKDGDRFWDALAYQWYPVTPGIKIIASSPCVIRHWLAIPGLVRLWRCNSPACNNRENDSGHSCYWCGAPERTT